MHRETRRARRKLTRKEERTNLRNGSSREKAGSLYHAATTTGLQKQTPHLLCWLLPQPTPCCHYVCLSVCWPTVWPAGTRTQSRTSASCAWRQTGTARTSRTERPAARAVCIPTLYLPRILHRKFRDKARRRRRHRLIFADRYHTKKAEASWYRAKPRRV